MAITRLPLTTGVSGTLPIGNGGTNVTTAADLANTGNLVKISTATISSDSIIEFTSGLDSTYNEYLVKFVSVHPALNGVNFRWKASTDGGSTYSVNGTHGYFQLYNNEAGSPSAINYQSSGDADEQTNLLMTTADVSNDADHGVSGELRLTNPSSTTFVKHYKTVITYNHQNDYAILSQTGGYLNTTSAVNAIEFYFSSGNLESGTITLYGVRT